jgi:hypothetical protein
MEAAHAEITEKECTKCKKVLPLSDYRVRKSGSKAGTLESRCHACMKEIYRKQNAKRNKRRKQKTHKLTERQVDFIRSLEGKYSTRKSAKIFSEVFFAHKINASTIARIWNGTIHGGASAAEKKRIEEEEVAMAAVLEKTREKARHRTLRLGALTKLLEAVAQDPELEPVDLPFHYRKRIAESGLEVEDLFSNPGNHTASEDWTKADSNVAAAVYLIEFTHAEEYEKKVYIGCTKQGVFKRWQLHIADQRADQTKRPSSVGTVEYRNLIRHLAATNQLHTVRVHVLEAVDKRHLKNKNDDKELRDITEAIEQDYQLKFFLGGYDLLNASFKVPSNRSSEVRQYIIENINKDLAIETQSLGWFAGRHTVDGIRWVYQPVA